MNIGDTSKSGSFEAGGQLGDDEQESVVDEVTDSIKTEWFGKEDDDNTVSNKSPSMYGPSNISDTSNFHTPIREKGTSTSLKKKAPQLLPRNELGSYPLPEKSLFSQKSGASKNSDRSKISKKTKKQTNEENLSIENISNSSPNYSVPFVRNEKRIIELKSINHSSNKKSVSSSESSSSPSSDNTSGKNEQVIEETKVDFDE